MSYEIVNVEQGSLPWFYERAGLVTASKLADVLSTGQRQRTFMMKMLAERITGKPSDNWTNEHTRRGHEDEPKARDWYCVEYGVDVEQVGFVKNTDSQVGYSPDGFVGSNGTIETKSKLEHLHLDILLRDKIPAAHVAQVQGGLWISEREWCDFICWCYGMPAFVKRAYRDEKKIKEIAEATQIFNEKLAEYENKIRGMQ
jgi:hypothetical protein